MHEVTDSPDVWTPTALQLTEIELANQEVREGKFATDEEMAETWRRFRR